MKNIFFFAVLCLLASEASGQSQQQSWIELRQIPGTNFYDIQRAFRNEWQGREADMLRERRERAGRRKHETEEEEEGYFAYKRWEYYMSPRVYPSGDLSLPSSNAERFNTYLASNPKAQAQINGQSLRLSASSTQAANWTFVGPTGAPGGGGAGRVNAVRVMPGNSSVLFACTPAGGIWKSANSGQSWTPLSDFLSSIGCTDVAIDPTNTNTLYLATGDGDAGDTYSIGVLKSTDGGVTWNTTGLVWTAQQQRQLSRLLIDPSNPNILYAGGTAGVWKTTNGGTNWVQVYSSSIKDMEFQPGNPNTIYACGNRFYRSGDAGQNWSVISAGIPASSSIARMAIAVTPADNNYVYVLAGVSGSFGFDGVYRSTDAGVTFTQRASSPNLLGWDPNGGDTDGQAWYDLAIAASPTDKDHLYTGGVNIWESTNGGSSWSLCAHWYGGGGQPYVHADVHCIEFVSGSNSEVFAGCDGGVFHTTNTGAAWSDVSSNLCIAQIYRFGLSASNATMLISGHQDNGTNLKNGTNYDEVLGGDGMDCFIDWSNNNVMYGELYYGDFNRSTNGGNSFQGITNGLSGAADWVTPWTQDPLVANTLYAGYEQVFKSTNQGNSWSQLGTIPGGGEMVDVEVAPSNNQYIYAARRGSIYCTTNGGTTWTNITPGVPVSSGQVSMLAISPDDEQTVYVALSGYSNGDKVFVSRNAGSTWSNISNGLPNIPANTVACVAGSGVEAIFVGMDAGVYYRDNVTGSWQPYFTGLPNTPVYELEIYKPTNKLRAATYGRGVWETDIDASAFVPLAQFTANTTAVCPGQSVQFTDQSTFSPTSWSWSFPGGNPSSSTQQNPSVTYNAPGTYQVTLVAANANGSDIETRTAYITVNGLVAPLTEGFVNTSFLPAGWTSLNAANQSVYWQRSSTTGHNSTESAFFNNLNNNVNGAQDEMHTASIDVTGYGTLTLGFDVAYARYNTNRTDTLEVLASTDCGSSWTQVYIKGGSTLATVPNQTSAFTPTNSQWRTETVSLNSFANQSSLMLAFRNRGHNGNYLWLDNININGTANAAPVAAFSSGSLCAGGTSSFTDLSSAAPTAWSWDFTGATPATSSLQNPQVVYASAGTYTVTLIASNSFGTDTIAQVITILPAPAANAGSDTSICSGSYVQLNASGGVAYSWSPSAQLSNATIANPSTHPTTATQYTVTVTDANGCSNTDSVRVNIMPLPTATVSGPGSVCYGDSAQLFLSGNALVSYTWTPSAFVSPTTNDTVWVFPTASTTYTIALVDTNGCAANITRYVSMYPAVTTPTITVNGNVLTSSTAFAYQWYLNNVLIPGATSQSYTAVAQGFYTVVTTASSGCTSAASASVLISVPENEAPVNGLEIFPNPSDGHFVLSFSTSVSADYSIEIEDVLGQVVFAEKLSRYSGSYSKTFDLTAFGKGAYVLVVRSGNNSISRKLVVY